MLSAAQNNLSSMHETKNVANSLVCRFKQKHKYCVHIYNHFLGCIIFPTDDHWKENKRDGFAKSAG